MNKVARLVFEGRVSGRLQVKAVNRGNSPNPRLIVKLDVRDTGREHVKLGVDFVYQRPSLHGTPLEGVGVTLVADPGTEWLGSAWVEAVSA